MAHTPTAEDVVTQAAVSPDKTVFSYGAQSALSNPDFFNKVKTQLIDEKVTFVEVDLSQMITRVYKEGVVTVDVPVKTKGREGSWWETPAGLYRIQTKEKSHYSSMGHVSQPWSMQFQGNFFIHGWPKYDNGTPVSQFQTCMFPSMSIVATIFPLGERAAMLIDLSISST